MSTANPTQGFGSLFWAVAACASPLQRAFEPGVLAPAAARPWARPRLAQALETVALWRARVQGRRRLQDLDEHLLKDIGLTRARAFAEGQKPFWRA
jgi:uncharacterized protein YjiS (DUF1127 family)